jgi:deoxyribose-phosphate aldolase
MIRTPVVRTPVESVMLERRAASFATRSIKGASKLRGLRLAISLLDLTTLEGKDSPERVRALCLKALRPDVLDPSLPPVAAVCVYPSLVPIARETIGHVEGVDERRAGELAGWRVKIASVSTAFPSGQSPLDVRVDETVRAVEARADEIDMVISRGLFLAGQFKRVTEEVQRVKEACRVRGGRGAVLKVILETGELETYEQVRFASELVMNAGLEEGDFIKTSTGKVQPAATLPVTLVMLEAVRDHAARTGVRIGVKPAGGIRTAKQALHYLVMVRETLGPQWLAPGLFRIGASTLLNDILMQMRAQRTGRYAALHDLSEG